MCNSMWVRNALTRAKNSMWVRGLMWVTSVTLRWSVCVSESVLEGAGAHMPLLSLAASQISKKTYPFRNRTHKNGISAKKGTESKQEEEENPIRVKKRTR